MSFKNTGLFHREFTPVVLSTVLGIYSFVANVVKIFKESFSFASTYNGNASNVSPLSMIFALDFQ